MRLGNFYYQWMLLAGLAISVVAITQGMNTSGKTAGVVDVSVVVEDCFMTFVAYPEKRIPATGNWGEELEIKVIDPDTMAEVYTETLTSNNLGQAISSVCPYAAFTEGKGYTVQIKGRSHLRKQFSNVVLTNFPLPIVDLTSTGHLLAGDTDEPEGNNIVNYLDINTLSKYIYTANARNDLNRDGEVNSLDIANMITNLDLYGI